jgi:FHS family L-fucose permease-like MFS transporter
MHSETLRVVMPYVVIGCFAALWAVLIALTKFPAFLHEKEHEAEVSGDWRDLLHQRHFLMAVGAQFLYTGAQTCIWSYLIQYAREYAHATDKFAGLLLTLALIIFGIGRFGSTGLMQRFSPSSIMTAYGLTNAALLLLAIVYPSWTGLIAVLITSFFLSVMFPTIFAMGLKDLGPNTNIAGSFIVMAIVGGAVLTPLMGWISQTQHSIAKAYMVPLLCYCGIALYSFIGVRMKRRESLEGSLG